MYRHTTAVTLAAAALLALTACSSGDGSDQAETAPATAAPATTEPATSASPTGGIPSPDPSQAAALIAALAAIDPSLVVDKDGAISQSRNVCLDITQGKDEATVTSNAQARFDGMDEAEAKRIVDAVKDSFCSN